MFKKSLQRGLRLVLAVLVGLAPVSEYVVAADADTPWVNFGEAPFAKTREEAFANRESAFRALEFPEAVIELLMIETESESESVRIVNGDRFVGMMSKDGKVMHNVITAFKTPPINGSMEYAAPAETWNVEWEGQTFVVYLPRICFNWAFQIESAQCAAVTYMVAPGDEVHFALLTRDRLPASACWELCDGDDCGAPPAPCDYLCDWRDVLSVLPTGLIPIHTGKYVAKHSHQTLRYPREAMDEYFAVCTTRDGVGQSDSWVVQPSAWQEQKGRVIVPYGGQQWPAWGKVDFSKWGR